MVDQNERKFNLMHENCVRRRWLVIETVQVIYFRSIGAAKKKKCTGDSAVENTELNLKYNNENDTTHFDCHRHATAVDRRRSKYSIHFVFGSIVYRSTFIDEPTFGHAFGKYNFCLYLSLSVVVVGPL